MLSWFTVITLMVEAARVIEMRLRLIALGRGTLATAFVEGRIGATSAEGVWGGVKFYFGQKDKSLIDRHRQDDPMFWSLSTLSTLNAAFKNSFIPSPPPPATSCSSSSCF